MKKILVTGAGGFVGLHLIDLLKKDYLIIGLTHPNKIPESENLKIIEGNILDKNLIEDIIKNEQPDSIIHLAAKASTWQSDPADAFKVNLFGTLHIYQAVTALKKSADYNPKILFISSAEVYGKTDTIGKLTEESLLNPVNFYGVSKSGADRLSFAYASSQKLNIIIIRPFNHAGPGQTKGFFIPDMASQIVEIENDSSKSEISVGNLESVRDVSDVRDIVTAYKLAIEKDFLPGEAYNVCSGNGFKMKDLLEKLLKMAKKEITVVYDPKRIRPADIQTTIGNNSKFVNLTGWNPKYTIDQTLKDTLDYWRQQFK